MNYIDVLDDNNLYNYYEILKLKDKVFGKNVINIKLLPEFMNLLYEYYNGVMASIAIDKELEENNEY